VTDTAARAVAELDADTERHGGPTWLGRLLLAAPIVAAVVVGLARLDKPLFDWLTAEDHPIEWGQFIVLLLAVPTFVVAAWRARSRSAGLAALFALAAVGSFVVAGEEISWGQRLLGFDTPTAVGEVNHQGETTIHNIGVLERLFNLAELVAGAYGLVVPILRLGGRVPASMRAGGALDPLVPPLALAACFGLAAAYRAARLVIPAGFTVTRFGELPELALDVAILGTAVAAVVLLTRTAEPAGRASRAGARMR
jgi:hypothetical protein